MQLLNQVLAKLDTVLENQDAMRNQLDRTDFKVMKESYDQNAIDNVRSSFTSMKV